MKKLLGLAVLCLLTSSIAYSDSITTIKCGFDKANYEYTINLYNDEGFDTQAIDTSIGRVFHSRDIQILETLFWPFMDQYGYTKMSKKQFKENLKRIRPWLDEPFKFEIDIHKKLPQDTPKIEDISELNKFRKNIIVFWELLNSNKAYRHIFKPL